MGFERWQSVAAEMKVQEAAVRRGVMRIAKRKVSGGLLKWREVAQISKSQESIL